jgi:hypothetical protein
MYSRDRLIKAIDNSACLTRRQINDYLQKKLYPEELYVVEMHLIECPFCNDAIEGFAHIDNANVFLSKVEDFNFAQPIKESPVEEPLVKRVIQKEATAKQPAPERKQQKDSSSTYASNNKPSAVFEEPKRRFSWPMGIAAALVVGFGIWGLSALFSDKNEDTLLADAREASAEVGSSGMINDASIDRKEDSIMNAKFAFHNQDPLPSSAKGTTIIRGNADEYGAEAEGVSMAEQISVAAAPASSAAAEKSSGFIGPVMPRDEETKKASAAKAVPATPAAKVQETTIAKNKPVETERKKVETTVKKEEPKAVAKAEPKATRTTTSEVAPVKKDEKKVEEEKSFKKAEPVISQAEKDFNKGMELYNKKQYAASIVYFQAAAKVSDFPKRKQAESYVKLAKNEVVNAERKKNSEQSKDK